MRPVVLSQHTLVVYLFAPLTGEEPEDALRSYAQLRAIWDHLAHQLKLPHPVDDQGVPADPPTDPPQTLVSSLLAGREARGEVVRQMWWDHLHDVACISITLEPADRPGTGWHGLNEQWVSAAKGLDLDGLLGRIEVLTALTELPTATPVDDAQFAAQVAAALPEEIAPCRYWADNYATTTSGLGLFQLTARHDEKPLRRLILLAPADGDGERGEWVWQSGLSRLAQYLLNAAKLRYQARVLHDGRVGVTQLRLEAGQRLAALQSLLSEDTATWPPRRLAEVGREVAQLQARASGLLDTLARISTMRRTVAIAAANMADLTSGIVEASRLFDDDQTAATRLDLELEDEKVYLEAASQRAQHFADLAARELSRQREHSERDAQQRASQLTLFQTAIIGTVLMALTAVQAFDYKIPVPAAIQPAIISALGALALLLYTITLRRDDVAHPQRVPPRLPALLICGASGLLGASLAWIAASLADLPATWPTPAIRTVWGAAGAAWLAGVVVAAQLLRRGRRPQGAELARGGRRPSPTADAH